MDAVISICIGSAAQLSLLLLPFAVLFSWAHGSGMDLHIAGIEAAGFMASVLLAALVMSTGRSTWMSGVILIVAYLIVAAAWFYQPMESDAVQLSAASAAEEAFTSAHFTPSITPRVLWERVPHAGETQTARVLLPLGRLAKE